MTPRARSRKLLDHRQPLRQLLPCPAENRACARGEYRGGAEDRAQDEGDRLVVRALGSQHPEAEQSGARQPVPKVSGRHQPGIRIAQPAQHDKVAEREKQRDRVNSQASQILARDDFQVRGRQGE
jgi:hypothetical protein